MSCDEKNNCNYEEFPPDEYSWFGESTKTFYHCYFSPKVISESDIDSHIFTGFCKVSDWFCILRDSIVVWSKDVVHSCPFRKVSDGYFDSVGTLITERSQKLGFQFKNIETNCGLDFLSTTEGLYLAPLVKELPILDTFESFADTRGLMDLTLADEDYRALELLNDEKEILLRECNIFVSLLQVLSFSNDKFMRMKDFKKKEVIVYSSMGQIFLPRCVKIPKINLVSKVGCYEDVPITFYLGKYLENGFLTQDRIIKTHSKALPCSNLPRYIKLPALNQTIVILNQKSDLTSSERVKFEKFDFYDQVSFKNFSHIDSLINGLDIIGQFHNLSISNENGGEWMTIPENSKEEGFGYILTKVVEWIGNWCWYLAKGFLFVVIVIILLLILGKIFFVLIKKCILKFSLRRLKQENIPNVLYKRTNDTASTGPDMPLAVPPVPRLDMFVIEDSPPTGSKNISILNTENEVFKHKRLSTTRNLKRTNSILGAPQRSRSASLNTVALLNSGSRYPISK